MRSSHLSNGWRRSSKKLLSSQQYWSWMFRMNHWRSLSWDVFNLFFRCVALFVICTLWYLHLSIWFLIMPAYGVLFPIWSMYSWTFLTKSYYYQTKLFRSHVNERSKNLLRVILHSSVFHNWDTPSTHTYDICEFSLNCLILTAES